MVPKIFWTLNSVRPKICFRPKIFSEPRFFLDSRFFQTKNFSRPQIFQNQNFLPLSDSVALVKPTYKILSNFRLRLMTRSWLCFPRHKNKKKSPHQNLQDRIELKIWNFAYRLKLIRLRSKAFQKFSAQKNFGSKKMLSQRKFLVKKNLVKNCLVKNMVPRRSKLWEKVHWPIWRLHTKSRLPAMLRILQKVFNICPSDKGRRQKKKKR